MLRKAVICQTIRMRKNVQILFIKRFPRPQAKKRLELKLRWDSELPDNFTGNYRSISHQKPSFLKRVCAILLNYVIHCNSRKKKFNLLTITTLFCLLILLYYLILFRSCNFCSLRAIALQFNEAKLLLLLLKMSNITKVTLPARVVRGHPINPQQATSYPLYKVIFLAPALNAVRVRELCPKQTFRPRKRSGIKIKIIKSVEQATSNNKNYFKNK
ncbi:hypothetical protein PUN28_005928 [Cardiocondyla obscurior]|uniref:Uncharacterized protein n=1 Tax=Cardiocondyla obscurior TaxID=286306 RepID=A0AAW2G6F3_9HYME